MRDKLILLAGIFWGEGCVRISTTGRKNHYLYVSVTNTDLDLLNEFVHVFGGRARVLSRAKIGYEPVWRWELCAERACDFLDQIAPFVGGTKGRAVELGRQWRGVSRWQGGSLTPEMKERRERLFSELTLINNPNGTRGNRRKIVSNTTMETDS
jgi:hypothetical protein